MGEVFEAWDMVLGRRVALKRLALEGFEPLIRFQREAQIQARLQHPHICPVYDVGEADGTSFISMRFVSGPTLAKKGWELPIPEAVRVMAQVANAIGCAHEAGLIHRDIKPSNILLEQNPDGSWHPYVTDFGLAKDLKGMALTMSQSPVGTPGFMAPEPLKGDTGSQASDIWALGATLKAVLPQELQGVGHSLRRVLDCCLSEDPRDRYRTAHQLAEDLACIARGLAPVHGRRMSRRATFLIRKGLHHPWTLGAAIVLGAGCLTAAFAWGHLRDAQRLQAARQLADASKDIEYIMQVERMKPAHDVRPALNEIRRRIQNLESGARGASPVDFYRALGRSYLAMEDYPQAQTHLQRAWDHGGRGDDLAMNLVLACCGRFTVERSAAQAEGKALLTATRDRYLEQAQRCLETLRDSGKRSFAAGKIAWLKNDFETALKFARMAAEADPLDARARSLEASACYGLGEKAQFEGRLEVAAGWYAQFESLNREARALAPSDGALMAQYLQQKSWWLYGKSQNGAASDQDFEILEALGDQLLALNPQDPDALSVLLTVYSHHAGNSGLVGRDPRPIVSRGLERLRQAGDFSDPNHRVGLGLILLLTYKVEWEYMHGLDPRPTVAMALKDAPPAGDERTELLLYQARWEREHGIDPTKTLGLVRQACLNTMHDEIFAFHHYYLGDAAWQEGLWRAAQGGDPSQCLAEAVQHEEEGLRLNPGERWCAVDLARIQTAWGDWNHRNKGACMEHYDNARKAAQRAIALSPRLAAAHRALAEADLRKAQALAEKGLDSSACLVSGTKAIRKALQFKPSDFLALLIQAELLAQQAQSRPGKGETVASLLHQAKESLDASRQLRRDYPPTQAFSVEFQRLLEQGTRRNVGVSSAFPRTPQCASALLRR